MVEASLFDEQMHPRVLYSSSTCALARAVSALHSRKVYPSALTRCTHGHQKKYGSRCFLSHGVGIRTWRTREEYESDASAVKLHRTLAQKVETKSQLKQRKKKEADSRSMYFEEQQSAAAAAAPAVVTV
jgi:hypothetical protein